MNIFKPETNIDKIILEYRRSYYFADDEDFEDQEWDHLWDSHEEETIYHKMVDLRNQGLLTLDKIEEILKDESPTHKKCNWCGRYTRQPLLHISETFSNKYHCLPCLEKGIKILKENKC